MITPLSLSMVLGAMLPGPIIGTLKRCQLVIVIGAVLMVVGSFLLTLLTPATSLWQAIVSMIQGNRISFFKRLVERVYIAEF